MSEWYNTWAAEKAQRDHESERRNLKRERDEALASMTHTLADGSVLQVRPADLPNFQLAIAMGADQRWVLADNTTRMITVAEMQEAVNSGTAQGQQIWADYAEALEVWSS